MKYSTPNMALALSLFTAGVPFAKDDKGRDVPCSNTYNLEMLQALAEKFPHKYKGLKPLDAARRAWKDGIPGRIEYHFEGDGIAELVKTWDKFNSIITALSGSDQGDYQSHPDSDDPICKMVQAVDPKLAMAIACQLLSNRRTFTKLWSMATPRYEAVKSKSKPQGDRLVIKGSIRSCSINAPEEHKRKLGFV
jgi:hypothetical protein